MTEIKAFENAIASGRKNLSGTGINTVFWAYRTSKEVGNEAIDFHEVIWDKDIAEIVTTCRANGIKEFTISCAFSSLIETLVEFEKHGCKMNGLTKVNAPYRDWLTDDYAVIPAIKMIL